MFTTDSRTERFLDSLGVVWKYTNEMTFGALTREWEKNNIGRSQNTIESAIRDYGNLMTKGSAAPAPILWRNPQTKSYEVLDGVQRLMAEQARMPATFSAYIANTDSASMVEKIRVFANYRLQGGYQEPAEWTLAQAIFHLVNTGKFTVEDVAEIGGWSPSVVRDKKEVMDCGFNVRRIGGPEKMTDSILRVVAKHSQHSDFDTAPAAVGEFLSELQSTKMSAEDATPYVEEFFSINRGKGRLHEQFKEKLDEFREDEEVEMRLADPTRRRHQVQTPEIKLMKSLKATLTAAKQAYTSKTRIAFMEEYFHVLGQVQDTLKLIETASRKKGTPRGKQR